MQASTPPPLNMAIAADRPVIDLMLRSASRGDPRADDDAARLHRHIWFRVVLTDTAYFFVDEQWDLLQVDGQIKMSGLQGDTVSIPVRYSWSGQPIKTVTYRCKRQFIDIGCGERIFQTIKRAAPAALKGRPPAELIRD